MLPDSLRYTSALSVGLAVVFVVITAGVTITKIINGSIAMPRLQPELVDQASFWKLFTTVPILVTAYICHHNGKGSLPSPSDSFILSLFSLIYTAIETDFIYDQIAQQGNEL